MRAGTLMVMPPEWAAGSMRGERSARSVAWRVATSSLTAEAARIQREVEAMPQRALLVQSTGRRGPAERERMATRAVAGESEAELSRVSSMRMPGAVANWRLPARFGLGSAAWGV